MRADGQLLPAQLNHADPIARERLLCRNWADPESPTKEYAWHEFVRLSHVLTLLRHPLNRVRTFDDGRFY